MISAVVLGAGLSQRMGTLKQLLPYGDRTVVEQVVSVLLIARVDEIVVVLGHRHDEVRQVLERWPVRVTYNPHYRDGMFTSIRHGWSQVQSESDAVLHVLVDQPQLQASVVRKLIATYRELRSGIHVPTFGTRRGHPILLDARYRSEVLGMGDGLTMRDFMKSHAAEVREMPVDTDTILRDMDTPQEYELEVRYREAVLVG